VRDQHLELAASAAPQQDARASNRHGLQSGVRRFTPAEFVLAHTTERRPPFVPEVRLRLADDSLEVWEATQVAVDHGAVPPPFWAFVWAGGQALARHLLDTGAAAGRDVLDVATGSGLVAIVAAHAGARSVHAVDIDELAVAATRLNARLNAVDVTVCLRDVRDVEVAPGTLVTVGDVFYDEKIAASMLTALSRLADAGAEVLVGDPRRAYLPVGALEVVASYDVDVETDIEDAPVKSAVVARLHTPRSRPV
jgi:predicted nicotinamide N-methyase